jgi:hypothetical protein
LNKGWFLLDSEFHNAIPLQRNAVHCEELSNGHPLLKLEPPCDEGGEQVPLSVQLDLRGSHPQIHHKFPNYRREWEPEASNQHPFENSHVVAHNRDIVEFLEMKVYRGRDAIASAETIFIRGQDQCLVLVLVGNKIWSTTTNMIAIRIGTGCH